MTGVYALHIKLVSYGNEAISSNNFTQQKITDDKLRFLIGQVNERKQLAADNPYAWFEWLKKDG